VQSSRNITVGEARIETMPQLEIYADDVKCSHGATVGQMNDDAILYMRQRGLSLTDAKRLQIEGFVDDVVLHSAVEGEVVAEVLTQLLADKLNEL
jgi:Fe-S cluster assembly protein SufD